MPATLILDFDGTITIADTISTLATSALAFRSKPIGEWDDLVTAYTTDYDAYIARSKPATERLTLADEVAFLRGLRPVEIASFSRVSASKVFAGITPLEWQALGSRAAEAGEVVLRDGYERLKSGEMQWEVLSVNFSKEWIRGVLKLGEEAEIVANSIDGEGRIRGPDGAEGELMATSDGKLEKLREMVKRGGGNGTERVIYVGDSSTDLECLLEDGVVGVVVSGDGGGSLVKTLSRIGVELRHVKDYDEGLKGLYWVRDLNELLDSLLFV